MNMSSLASQAVEHVKKVIRLRNNYSDYQRAYSLRHAIRSIGKDDRFKDPDDQEEQRIAETFDGIVDDEDDIEIKKTGLQLLASILRENSDHPDQEKETAEQYERRMQLKMEYYADALPVFEKEDVEDDKRNALNARGAFGRTPAHICVMENDSEGLENLHAQGADFSILDNNGHTPWQLAILDEKYHILEVFKQLGVIQ